VGRVSSLKENTRNLLEEVNRLREIAELVLRLRRDGELPKGEAIRLLELLHEELLSLASGRELRAITLIEQFMNLIERLPISSVPALERLADKLPPLLGVLFPRPREVVDELGFIVERVMERLMERTLVLDELLRLLISFDPEVPLRAVDKAHLGYLAEVIGRCWLRDVLGGPWRYAEYKILDGKNVKDVDALSLSSEADTLVAYMAEVKLTANRLEKDVEKVAETIKKVDEFCMKQRAYGLGKRHEIREVALICYTPISDEVRKNLVDRLLKHLRPSLKEKRVKNFRVYDLNAILDYCEKTPQGANIAKSVKILSELMKQENN
jgi:hypothetical protein